MLLLTSFTMESVRLSSNPDSGNYCCVTLDSTTYLNSFICKMGIKKDLIESLQELNKLLFQNLEQCLVQGKPYVRVC